MRLNGVKTFIAGGMQLGYLQYSPTCEEIEDYVQSYAGRMGEVTAFFKQYPEGRKALTDNIESLDLPVQVFWGDEDAILKVDNAHLLHSKLPHSALHVFESCGHFSYQDQSSAFATLIQDWVLEKQFTRV